MKRSPNDPYNFESDSEREPPTKQPWSVFVLGIGLAGALVLYALGVV
jgi:hypothetical protein